MNTAINNGAVLTVNDVERSQAKEVMAARSDSTSFAVVIKLDSRELTLPQALTTCLTNVMSNLATGGSTRIESMPKELSSTVAARHLGVSRPTLMKHVASGALPSRKVGTHTRIRTSDLVTFRERLLDDQLAAFAELRRISDALGEE